ncbi:PE family protein [Mycobacterium haemophilum]|uniref:PE domain-containing protein n=1 Tax=Mycobacterium haemophilum TaxID=29311 RepID=A0A0I9V2R7_9MYCO|nr:PE family protein [Mycobacterium haemophilum]KLO28929.1 hypothetical protein ABH39_13275 [Mycobacterium haemophilum]KLO35638.1 hypothetical protein ABH38_15050 [Mycobacterium haemophilum]KLO41117.1 hypothetical protein ABH37_14415 [Mycobacterium haemophilum]KLO49098.1 hypothetical protein ABH36_14220 [Mycobacterium haemophilum]
MSFVSAAPGDVSAVPEALKTAATDVRAASAHVVEFNGQVSSALTGVAAPAIDVLSQKAAAFLRMYTEQYQQTLAQGMAILDQFSEVLAHSSAAYSTAEDNNAETFA